jgi:tetratricopeptide (TPR) repeat protein
MTEDRIEKLLRQADRTAGRPAPVSVKLSVLRRRACRRRVAAAAASAAAVLLIALGIWAHFAGTPETTHNRPELVKLEDQVRQLQATTDAALSLVREVIEDERKQRRLDEFQAQLAGIPDPREEIQKQIDKTAFTLVYQADRLYYELNRTDSAVEAYNQVIMFFPKNRWADVARKRLEDIENAKL